MSTTEYLDTNEESNANGFKPAFDPSALPADSDELNDSVEPLETNEAATPDPAREGDHRKHKAPDPIGLGFSRRQRRIDEAMAVFRQQVRIENPRLSADQVEVAARAKLEDFCKDADEETWVQFMKLRPVSVAPNRTHMIDLAEVAAVRRLPEIQELEQCLLRSEEGSGPTPGNAFPVAAIEYMCFNKQIPRIREAWQRFNGSDLHLDHAYGNPSSGKSQGTEAGLTAAIHRILGTNDPLFAMAQNIRLAKRLAEMKSDTRIGRYLTIDGTMVEANVLLKRTYSTEHFDVVNRNYKSKDGRRISAIFTRHNMKKQWRGYTLLVIVDQKTTLPLAWSLVTGDNKGLWENHI